ncbi:MAG: TetR/AcrR family transcriptional regulator [Acetatifactor sp.]|jgi:Transcriptional regulator|nr:TetR/AcrR family transcriptional regulator [Acetatifactor sp.]
MNDKFFSLPIEKQEAIINAGFRIFSQNSYKRSPMSEIADAAGISKSLLFHYFHNKKELYLFLWNRCEEITLDTLEKSGCYAESDLFARMYRGTLTKIQLMRRYPDLGTFALKAFYEKDPAVSADVQKTIAKYANYKSNPLKYNFCPEQFRPGLDLEMMYRDMLWATEGYLWEVMQLGIMDVDKIEHDFMKLIDFWKSIYLRKE